MKNSCEFLIFVHILKRDSNIKILILTYSHDLQDMPPKTNISKKNNFSYIYKLSEL